MTRRATSLGGWALGLIGALAAATTGRAQSISVDPYDPWNMQYRQFVFPTAPPSASIPNMGRLDTFGGGSRANRFQDYLQSTGAGLDDPFGRTGRVSRFTPYYRSYRQLDSDLERTYVPNRNDTFYDDQADRERRYFDAMRERDPKRRAELLRELQQANAAALRASSSAGVRRAGASDRGDEATDSSPAGRAEGARSRTPAPAPDSLFRTPADPARSGRLGLPSDPGTAVAPRSAPGPGLLRRPTEPADDPGPSPSRVLERSRATSRTGRAEPQPPIPPGLDPDLPEAPLTRPRLSPVPELPVERATGGSTRPPGGAAPDPTSGPR